MNDTQETERPSPAGVYDAALGGTANTAADRALIEHARLVMPHVIQGAWANRGFLQRAVKRMVSDWGIHQFIDLGSGMPTQRNTHQVVAEIRADGRVVYVDNDPRVIAQARELLVEAGHTTVIQADIREPEAILNHPETRRLIDFSEPIGLLVVAVTHFVPDEDDPWSLVARYVEAIPSGSYLALSSVTSDRQEETWEAVLDAGRPRGYEGYPRTKAEVDRFFAGLEIVPPYPGAQPGVAFIGLWDAEDPELADDDGSRLAYAAVARKP
ncbi:MAG TPA: SAM-dependent methyltransferase [Rugosimonospora sp.]|nr:SAM-dependent methyltransferase [Rugosimonospora sp.]